MNWIAQVLHVMRKDVRELWWVFLPFLATVGLGLFKAFVRFDTPSDTPSIEDFAYSSIDLLSAFAPYFLLVMGAVAIAVIVQSDSPSRSNSFWITRPIARSAMLTAKLLLTIGALAGSAMLGAYILLRELDAQSVVVKTVLFSIGFSSVIGALSMAVLAGISQDVKSFVVATLCMFVLSFFVAAIPMQIATTNSAAFEVALVAIIAMGLAFLVQLSQRHDRSRTRVLSGIAISTMLLNASFASSSISNPEDGELPTIAPVAELRMTPMDNAGWGSIARLPVRLKVSEQLDSVRLDFIADSIHVRVADGNDLTIRRPPPEPRGLWTSRVADGWFAPIAGGAPWSGRKVRWLHLDSGLYSWKSESNEKSLGALSDSTVRAKVVSVRTLGTVILSRARIYANLPLEQNASSAIDGRRILISKLRVDGRPEITIHISSLPRPGIPPSIEANSRERDALKIMLVNEERGEAMMVVSNSSGAGTSSLVVPQIHFTTSSTVYTPRLAEFGPDTVKVTPDWYRNARLVVMEWIPVAQYKAEVSGAVK